MAANRYEWPEPGNKKDRAWFDDMTPADQDMVREVAAILYDGTRTVARCWREALSQVTASRMMRATQEGTVK